MVLTQSVRQSDVIGRVGGDEFVALVMYDDKEELASVKHRIAAAFCSHHQLERLPLFTVSIGITDANPSASICELLDLADRDMMQRKRKVVD